MPTCRVKRNNSGRITKVTNEDGTESKLYNTIVKHPMIQGEEEALGVFKNTLIGKLGENPIFTHRVNEEIVDSYKTALKKAKEGDSIEIGFKTDKGFQAIISVNKTTNRSSSEGFINSYIESNTLSPEKKMTKDGYKYKAAGNSYNAQVVNAELIRDSAGAFLGVRGIGKDGVTFRIEKTNDKSKVINHKGETIEMTKGEIDGMTYEELKKLTPFAIDFITAREYAKSKPAYGFTQPEMKLPSRSEGELEILLKNLLNKMGVSTMSIAQYVEKYNIKNGVDPKANALADIANKVVAFHDGEMGLEALTEEVSHFITEAMPQEEVESILKNIHKSEEWAEHAEAYRDVYSKKYEGEALEDAIRREVLGKVMANSILNSFDTQGKTAQQQGFIAQALNVVTKFFERIKAYFKPEYKTQLDTYLENVQEILRADEISDMLNTDNFDGNNKVLYSTKGVPKSTITLSAEKAASTIRDQIQSALARANRGSSINKQKLQNLQEKLEENEELGAVGDITGLTKNYITMLTKAVEDAKKNEKSYIFTQEENIIFQALKNQLLPSLAEIKVLIKDKKDNRSEWKQVEEEIKDVNKAAFELKGIAKTQDSNAIGNLIDKIMIRHELPDSSREYIEKWVKEAESDTNFFHSNFGMLTHSKDGLLNLAGQLQKDITTQSNIKWQDSTKRYQQRLKKLGISEKEISQFIDGQFIVSDYDFNKFENIIQRIEANLYKEIADSKLSIEEIIEGKKEGTLDSLDEDVTANIRKEAELRRRLKDLRNPLLERKFNTEYYEKFEGKLSGLGITQEGVKYVMNYYGDMSQFKRAAQRVVKDENGEDKMIMDFSQLSEQDKAVRDNIIRDRNNAKSYYNEDGKLKEGLEFDRDGEIVATDNISLHKNAQIAIDLNKLDDPENRDSSINTENVGIPDIFLDSLREIESTQGREAAIEFLFMNSFIGFTDEYWDSADLAGGGGLTSKLEQVAEDPEARSAKDTLANIKKDRAALKSVLKVYRSKNNPSEIDVDAMPRATRDTVKNIQQRLVDRYKQARDLTKDIKTENDKEKTGSSSVNEAYLKKLEDLNATIDFDTDSIEEALTKLKEEVEFSTEHMTEANRNSVNTSVESLRLFILGKEHGVSPLVEKTANELGIDVLDIQVEEQVEIMQTIIRSRMLPYYTRFAPNQYKSFMEEVTSGTESLADLIPTLPSKYNYMEINPNFSFFDSTQNDNINPNYVENFEGGYLQPKKKIDSKAIDKVLSGVQDTKEKAKLENMLKEGGVGFESKKFKDTFKGDTTSNLYQAYQATLDYNRESLGAMGVGNSYNVYTIPQVKQSGMQRFEKFTQGASLDQIKEALNETLTYTEDDKIQGERSKFGDSIKIIPKMYVDRIDNPEDVSTELFYSLALRASESYLREARVEHYGDFMAIQDKIVNRTYKGGESKGENTLKMFESAMDYSLFGIKETAMYPIETAFGTIDVAKLARNLLGFVKFRNLGFNIVIPITSYLTGRATREIEKWVGEHMDARSQILGDKEFRKHSREAISEIGEINTKSKLSVMGQYFRAFDMQESFQNSNYSKLLRFLPRTGMMLHAGANFPIYGSTMLGVLHDFRVVNGSIMRFNQFERQKLSEGVDKKEIKNKWDSLESEAIYNFININENSEVEFEDKAIRSKLLNKDGEKMSDSEYEAFKTEKINAIRGHISNVISNIDGQIPNEARVHAQRHFALNYFMTHRGWLSIVASRRFKNRHLNVETGEVEEGTYRTLWNFMGRYLKEYKKGNFGDFVKAWKVAYDSADPTESALLHRNMKRIGIEMSMLNGLMLIGFLLNGMADDDEYAETYGIQGLSYLFNRTMNEMSSAQLGSVNNFSEVIESPFVGWNTVKTFTDVGDLFNGEQVKRGTYRGLSERQRFLTKLVPGAKQVYDLSDAGRVKRMRSTYMFYNGANFNYTPLGNLYWLADDK